MQSMKICKNQKPEKFVSKYSKAKKSIPKKRKQIFVCKRNSETSLLSKTVIASRGKRPPPPVGRTFWSLDLSGSISKSKFKLLIFFLHVFHCFFCFPVFSLNAIIFFLIQRLFYFHLSFNFSLVFCSTYFAFSSGTLCLYLHHVKFVLLFPVIFLCICPFVCCSSSSVCVCACVCLFLSVSLRVCRCGACVWFVCVLVCASPCLSAEVSVCVCVCVSLSARVCAGLW